MALLDVNQTTEGYRVVVLQEDGKPLVAISEAFPSWTEAELRKLNLETYALLSTQATRSR